jgi:hypothetical protein
VNFLSFASNGELPPIEGEEEKEKKIETFNQVDLFSQKLFCLTFSVEKRRGKRSIGSISSCPSNNGGA